MAHKKRPDLPIKHVQPNPVFPVLAPGASPENWDRHYRGMHFNFTIIISVMQEEYLNRFKKAISSCRYESYRTRTCASDADVVARYLWNVELCEAMYPSLHALEVCLRNTIHDTLTLKHGATWYSSKKLPLMRWQLDAIEKAQADVLARKHAVNPPDVVAELSFGFWASLMNKRYENDWRGLLKTAFKELKGSDRKRSTIADRLHELRDVRNRVFHHERIFDKDLSAVHAKILETIGWISPSFLTVLKSIDRLPKVFSIGPAHCLEALHRTGLTEYKQEKQQG